MISISKHWGRSRAGLTLAELMVAAGILAVITAFSAQVMGDVTRIWTSGKGRSDTFTAARALMTRMRTDIERCIPIPDLPGFARTPSASSLELTTRVPGILSGDGGAGGSQQLPRPLSFVRYRLGAVGSEEGGYLVREDRAFLWDEPPFGADEGSARPRRICPNVIGFASRFVAPDGELQDQYVAPPRTNQTVAVFLALAVCDDREFQRMKLTGVLSQVTESFSSLDPQEWEEELAGANPSMPPVARQGVRVFQQTVPLPSRGRKD